MRIFFLFHPHNVLEECHNNKYHIVDNMQLKTLCGIDTTKKLLKFSCNSEAITKEWYVQNLKNDVDGVVCKKCAKKLKSLLGKSQLKE